MLSSHETFVNKQNRLFFGGGEDCRRTTVAAVGTQTRAAIKSHPTVGGCIFGLTYGIFSFWLSATVRLSYSIESGTTESEPDTLCERARFLGHT